MRKYITEDDTKELSSWVRFYPKFSGQFYIEKAGYFDERPVIRASVTQLLMVVGIPIMAYFCLWSLILLPLIFFGWGILDFRLPIKTGIEDCESGGYGTNYHNNTFWIYTGDAKGGSDGKSWITYDMPWQWTHYRTSLYLEDKTWINSYHFDKVKRHFYEEMWKKIRWEETHPYLDLYDNSETKATIHVEEREWRMKGLMWFPYNAKINRVIEIDFHAEVGSKKGSWKGGVMGTSHPLLDKETPLESLKRMEKTRKS